MVEDPNASSSETSNIFHGKIAFGFDIQVPEEVRRARESGCIIVSEIFVGWTVHSYNNAGVRKRSSNGYFHRSYKGVAFSSPGVSGTERIIFNPMANSGGLSRLSPRLENWNRGGPGKRYVEDWHNLLNPKDTVNYLEDIDEQDGFVRFRSNGKFLTDETQLNDVASYIRNVERSQQTNGSVDVMVDFHVFDKDAADDTVWRPSSLEFFADLDLLGYPYGGIPNRLRDFMTTVQGQPRWADKDSFSISGAKSTYVGIDEMHSWDWRASNTHRPSNVWVGDPDQYRGDLGG